LNSKNSPHYLVGKWRSSNVRSNSSTVRTILSQFFKDKGRNRERGVRSGWIPALREGGGRRAEDVTAEMRSGGRRRGSLG